METLVTRLFIVHDNADIVLNTAIADLKDDLRRRTEEVGRVTRQKCNQAVGRMH